ncbi:MAG TPA: hypothetical protein VFJ70_01305 [Burkholderiales bacterium]|nr:hypothetical protein [Burkholderiales bacterium]
MRDAARFAPLVVLLSAAALLQGCATEPVTTLEMTWVSPQLPQEPFKRLLIISVARDEFVQIAFQDQMAAALKARGVNAVASKRYFSSDTEAEKARFKQSIDDSGADFVLIAHVTGRDTKTRDDRFMTVGDATGIYTAYDRYVSVARSQSDYSRETVTAEVSIFRIQGEKLIWSARTRTANPRVTTGEDFAPHYIAVILEAMRKDKLL